MGVGAVRPPALRCPILHPTSHCLSGPHPSLGVKAGALPEAPGSLLPLPPTAPFGSSRTGVPAPGPLHGCWPPQVFPQTSPLWAVFPATLAISRAVPHGPCSCLSCVLSMHGRHWCVWGPFLTPDPSTHTAGTRAALAEGTNEEGIPVSASPGQSPIVAEGQQESAQWPRSTNMGVPPPTEWAHADPWPPGHRPWC